MRACLILAIEIQDQEITTIEGLAKDGQFDPLQEAFISCGAVQCGFCTPGMIMAAKYLLQNNSNPKEDEIRKAISGNICRCTGYAKIVEAIDAAAKNQTKDL